MAELLQLPFMQRALLAGLVLGVLLSYLGIFVTLRRMAFFSDGIAHAALAGAAIGLLTRFSPLLSALAFSMVLAAMVYWLEKKSPLSSDAIIGILFTSGMALGVVLISLRPGYQPELIGYLFGNILAIRLQDLALITALAAAILAFIAVNKRKLTLLALDREMACMAGINPDFYELLLYIVLACALVLGIRILGVILVSALLITPVSTARLFSRSFRALAWWTVLLAEFTMLAGVLLSYFLDLPTGAVIVLTGSALFSLIFIGVALRQRFARHPACSKEKKAQRPVR
ncbi:MAG: metal ABC transporter permease [Acidobacteria bacterium]|jgi:zinc transport system permease protein|nr:metal ABC transporter permease [Acidobacteriota bacterium]